MQIECNIPLDVYVNVTESGFIEVSVYTSDYDDEVAVDSFSLLELITDAETMYEPLNGKEDLEAYTALVQNLREELRAAMDKVTEMDARIQTGAFDGRD